MKQQNEIMIIILSSLLIISVVVFSIISLRQESEIINLKSQIEELQKPPHIYGILEAWRQERDSNEITTQLRVRGHYNSSVQVSDSNIRINDNFVIIKLK
jgi:hypothetical protein